MENSLAEIIAVAGASTVGGGSFTVLMVKFIGGRAIKKFDEALKVIKIISDTQIKHNIHIENLLKDQKTNKESIATVARLETIIEDKEKDIDAAHEKIRQLETELCQMKANWVETNSHVNMLIQNQNRIKGV